MTQFKVLVTTTPFGVNDTYPIDLLKQSGIQITLNQLGRKITENDFIQLIDDHDAVIAGTENISSAAMDAGSKLKFIARVGVGLDSVDLLAAKKRGIMVSYTPDAPAAAVCDLALGLMFGTLRHIFLANSRMHQSVWMRSQGRRLKEMTVGIIGVGRIGKLVLQDLLNFGVKKIYLNDLEPNLGISLPSNVQWVSKEEVYSQSQVITLHVPLNDTTKNMISTREFLLMRQDAILINLSRGGIVNEANLYTALKSKRILSAAIDVFENEPYTGALNTLENCILTPHLGSMSDDCRYRMEVEAAEEVVRFFRNEELSRPVPWFEYK